MEDMESEEEDEEGDEADEDMKEEKEKDKKDEVDENLDHPNYKADYIKDVAHNAGKIKGGLNESFDGAARFRKLANIK